MNTIRVIRKDDYGEVSVMFSNCPQYEALKKGDIVEAHDHTGELKDYMVTSTNWEFSHFGNRYVIIIEQMKPRNTNLVYTGIEWVDSNIFEN